MPPTERHELATQALKTVVLRVGNSAVVQFERELDAAGYPIPIHARSPWLRYLGSPEDRQVLALRDDRCVAMTALSLSHTRALPGHYVLRVKSFGDGYASPAGRALLGEVSQYAKSHGRILRVVVELQCRSESNKAYLRCILQDLGYKRAKAERIPERTLQIDLCTSEEKLLAGFRKSTRHGIRGAARHGLEVTPIKLATLSGRMNALFTATMSRTGGQSAELRWAQVMRLCQAIPHRSRLVGIFRGQSRDPEDLLAFAWGLHHGERAEYHAGASARGSQIRNSISLSQPLLWDLISWAKREGATWFDLGGVAAGSCRSEEALGGISEFKRGFSKNEIELGEEWAFEPSPAKAWVANIISCTKHAIHGKFPCR